MNKKVKAIAILLLAYLLVMSSLAYALGTLSLTVSPSSSSSTDGAYGSATITETNVPTPQSATVTLQSTLPLWWGLLYYNKAQVSITFSSNVNSSTSYDVILQFKNSNGEVVSGGSTQITGNGGASYTVDIPLEAWIPRADIAGMTVELTVLPIP
ncbi:MAG: hypothetical protein F7B18_03670 [Desulfurococcales archaeon]|nr:hypothetical protein [Desulfurococcales archaeon]